MLQTKSLIETANRSLAELPALIEDVKRMSERADELLVAFSHITRSAKAGVSRFEGLATRSSTLASSLLDEVERPLSNAVGLMRGLRSGANYLMQLWSTRAASRSHTNQGDENVGEQRWLDDGGIPAGSGGRSRTGADSRANGR
jgi:hypothetical protein